MLVAMLPPLHMRPVPPLLRVRSWIMPLPLLAVAFCVAVLNFGPTGAADANAFGSWHRGEEPSWITPDWLVGAQPRVLPSGVTTYTVWDYYRRARFSYQAALRAENMIAPGETRTFAVFIANYAKSSYYGGATWSTLRIALQPVSPADRNYNLGRPFQIDGYGDNGGVFRAQRVQLNSCFKTVSQATLGPLSGKNYDAMVRMTCQLPDHLAYDADYWVIACIDRVWPERAKDGDNNCNATQYRTIARPVNWTIQPVVLAAELENSFSTTVLRSGASIDVLSGGVLPAHHVQLPTDWRLALQRLELGDALYNEQLPGYLDRGLLTGADPHFCSRGPLTENSSEFVACSLPALEPSADYLLVACLDAVVDESDLSDNCYGLIRRSAPPVDGDVQSLVLIDQQIEPGDTVLLYADLAFNQGVTMPSTAHLRVWLQAHASGDPDYHNQYIPGYLDTAQPADAMCQQLVAAESARLWLSCDLPGDLVAGSEYLLVACVDRVAGEVDTSNNCYGTVREIHGEPDWAVHSVELSNGGASLAAGVVLPVVVGVQNMGLLAAPATTLRLRLHPAQSPSEHGQNIAGYFGQQQHTGGREPVLRTVGGGASRLWQSAEFAVFLHASRQHCAPTALCDRGVLGCRHRRAEPGQ